MGNLSHNINTHGEKVREDRFIGKVVVERISKAGLSMFLCNEDTREFAFGYLATLQRTNYP
jgi:hypothetical protein